MKKLLLSFMLVFALNSFAIGIPIPAQRNTLIPGGPDFVESCAIGLIAGCKVIRKFAVNPSTTLNVKRDIWDFGSSTAGDVDYTYPTDGTAPIDSISSSATEDIHRISIEGLDINGDDITFTATLNGQIRVILDEPLWRIYRMKNLQVSTTASRSLGFTGNIYVYENTTLNLGVPVDISKVRAYIENGNNQTQMSQYTIPNGWTGFVYGRSFKSSRKQASITIFQTWIRDYGSVFRLVDTSGLNTTGTGAYNAPKYIPKRVNSKSDIVVGAETDASGAGVVIAYYMVLLKNSVWGL